MQCLQDMGDGTFQLLVPQPATFDLCTTLLTSQTELSQATFNSLLGTFNELFTIPSSELLGIYWSLGFSTPMTLGLVSFGVAKLVSFWDN